MGQGQFETDAEYAASQGLLYLDDLKSARFGTGQDFRIWYTGGNARLVCADGDIQFNHATSYDTAEGGETFDPDDQESMLHLEDDAGVKAYYNGVKKFETLSDGAKVHGTLQVDGNFKLLNDKKLICGYDDDLQIYHDTTGDDFSTIKNTTSTQLFIANNNKDIFIRADDGKDGVRLHPSGEDYKVELFWDDTTRLTTWSDGVFLDGGLWIKNYDADGWSGSSNHQKLYLGYDKDLQLYHEVVSGSDDYSTIKNTTATQLFIANTNKDIFLRANDGKDGVRLHPSGENYKVELFHNDEVRLTTWSDGIFLDGGLHIKNYDADGWSGSSNHQKLYIGYDKDLQLYHEVVSGGDDYSTIKNTTETELFIANSGESIFIRADDGKNGIRLYADNDGADYEVVLYHGGDTEAFRTVSGGSKVTGDLEVTATVKPNEIKLVNDKKIKIGYDDDLQIYHDTSPSPDASMIKNTTATELFIVNGGDESVFIRANTGKDGVRCWDSSESYKVGLFYDDTLKLETTNTGAKVTGTLETTGAFQPDEIKLVNDKKIKIGYDDDLQIYHDTGPSPDASMIKNTTATQMFIANSNESIFIRANDGIDGVRCFPSSDSYKVQIFYDDSPKLQTQSTGVEILGDVRFDDNCKVSLGTGQDLDIYWDGSKSWFNQNAGYFQFNKDIWPRYNYTSGSKQDLGDGDYRWDDVYCDDVEEASDGRYKENIATSDLGLDFINKLTPRSYTKIYGTSGRTHYGLVAQEVEKVITDSGKTTKEFGGIGISEGGMYGLRYNQFLSPLIKAVQELSAEVETLKAEIAALKSS